MTDETREERPAPVAAAYDPLYTYKKLDMFRDRLRGSRSHKSPSLLALQALTHSKPGLAKRIFESAILEPFHRLLITQFPAPTRISDEGAQRVAELRERFLQEPIRVAGALEEIFVIERIEPWARDTAAIMSQGRSSLEQVRESSPEFAQKMEHNGCALAWIDLASYVRERDYRIMLELVSAIDGRPVEQQARRILDDLPVLKAHWDDFGEGTTESILGPEGASRIVQWIIGYTEF